MKFKLTITDSESPTWKFEDVFDNYEKVRERINEKLLTWRDDFRIFTIVIEKIK